MSESNKLPEDLNKGIETFALELQLFIDRCMKEYTLSYSVIYSGLHYEASRVMRDWLIHVEPEGEEPPMEGEGWKQK